MANSTPAGDPIVPGPSHPKTDHDDALVEPDIQADDGQNAGRAVFDPEVDEGGMRATLPDVGSFKTEPTGPEATHADDGAHHECPRVPLKVCFLELGFIVLFAFLASLTIENPEANGFAKAKVWAADLSAMFLGYTLVGLVLYGTFGGFSAHAREERKQLISMIRRRAPLVAKAAGLAVFVQWSLHKSVTLSAEKSVATKGLGLAKAIPSLFGKTFAAIMALGARRQCVGGDCDPQVGSSDEGDVESDMGATPTGLDEPLGRADVGEVEKTAGLTKEAAGIAELDDPEVIDLAPRILDALKRIAATVL